MKKISGAEMVIKSLIKQKVKYIFGYPGGAVLDIYDALYKIGKIRHILVRHEQAATHMADGYTRSTGKIGVVLVTSGPGATNSITGIATAYMDSIPMIVISGQVDSKLIGYDAFQECDMIGISRPIVKHSFLVQKTEDIPIIFNKAFYIAYNQRPGPVVIDLPKDLLNIKNKKKYKKIKKNNKIFNNFKEKKIKKKKIYKILKQLYKAKKPIIYIGGGIIHSNSCKEILYLAEKINLPVTTTLMGLGAFPGSHPQCVSMLGMHGTYEANMSMHNADIIFAIGVRFDDRTTNNLEKYCPKAKIIHIDIDPTSISKTIKSNIHIIGDAKKILKKICKKIKSIKNRTNLTTWWKKILEWKNKKCLNFVQKKNIKPQTVIKNIYKITQGNAYITTDVGQHQMFTALYYTFNKPRRWINSGGLGTMGFGLPAALGVKLAFPKKIVICITGDGSIQMNIQELSTAMQYKLPILIINLNNSALGMVKQWQDIIYNGRHSQSYMKSLPKFTKLAKSYGHVGIEINKIDNLKNKLKQSINYVKQGKLVLVDIKIDFSENVYPMQIKGGGMNEMYLREELK